MVVEELVEELVVEELVMEELVEELVGAATAAVESSGASYLGVVVLAAVSSVLMLSTCMCTGGP